mgnify:CR=1 FL=1
MFSLDEALSVAIDAARQVGVLLRRELHRPTGPRGADGCAPVDAEVEAMLRDRLTSAFPDVGLRAEERPDLDRPPSAPGGPFWLVDPNDGTAAFQKGHRGSSISIGLVRDGLPVLGVVYAYAAPDDRGDLIAWAEGCGPLTRNGQPLPDRTWPSALGRDHVVLVSNAADGRPLANARAVAPARYRPAPGIAYRLALAAAGDAVAAVSLNGPRAFDVAGGHALLRGAGGVLVDDRARPVTYRYEDPPPMGFCFGGAATVCADLAGRDWRPSLDGPWHPPEEIDLVRPMVGQLITDAAHLCRGQGCWLGQLVGDALGSQVEFDHPADIALSWPGGVRALRDGGTHHTVAGQPTDDSELAMALARALLDARGFDEDTVARAYRWWYTSRPFDVGRTTSIALSEATGDHPAARARAAASRSSQANGALMRVAPLCIVGHVWPEAALVEAVHADARLTHPHPVCLDANVAFALGVAFALREGAGPRAVYNHTLAGARALGLHADVLRTLEAAATAPPADFMQQQGWVLLALQNAFYQLNNAPDFESGLVDTVGRGGDTDTNGCIAGALLGAVHGRDGIPAAWRGAVLTCRPIAGLAGVQQPRPRGLWPVDALVTAERLLALGQGLRAVTGPIPKLARPSA